MYLKLLERGIRQGTLELQVGSGERYRFGDSGPQVNWWLRNHATGNRIARNYELQLGETYVNGDWSVPDGNLQDLLTILRSNFVKRSPPLLHPVLKFIQQCNNLRASYHNVASHYDLDRSLFELFLDRDMHYSCAYFEGGNADLEKAQQAKCRHIGAKLLLRPGHRVLDIGCGWGSFARYLARHYDVSVVGITLSQEQFEFARNRGRSLAMQQVEFLLEDYRQHRGQYDRVVSIGMFEHVGRPYYHRYFQLLRELLTPDGVALVHSIGRCSPPRPTNPWIRRHVFPGGAIPALSEMTAAAERAGLIQTDIEALRLHYAYTLHAWYERFQSHRRELAERMGERFCRMWEFYLAISEVSFTTGDLLVYQQQLANEQTAVPITRDYLYDEKRRTPAQKPLQPASSLPRRS
jgi:cyclopropane-fatty-acyl-phospholipid synthase